MKILFLKAISLWFVPYLQQKKSILCQIPVFSTVDLMFFLFCEVLPRWNWGTKRWQGCNSVFFPLFDQFSLPNAKIPNMKARWARVGRPNFWAWLTVSIIIPNQSVWWATGRVGRFRDRPWISPLWKDDYNKYRWCWTGRLPVRLKIRDCTMSLM